MRVLVLERVVANAVILGARSWANLWLLPSPTLVGQRVGLRAESVDDGWWYWALTQFGRSPLKLPPLDKLRRGDLGTVEIVGSEEPGKFGPGSHGPAVWVFRAPRAETVPKGARVLRAGYGDQPHVIERDKLQAARESQ